ncbi:hypothetical protein DL93DRAFT_2081473 [Clavulina sp. PMI_390]|nr:hypothetical protein DL93DRAFT_2081473 [Clavulina sp. PMI_390]
MSSNYQPLSTSDAHEEAHLFQNERRERHVVFAIDEDEEEDDRPLRQYADDESISQSTNHSIGGGRIGPPLRSTISSREAEFDLDSDELDNTPLVANGSPRRHGDNSMPRFQGLMHSSRQSTEIPLATVADHSFLSEDASSADALKMLSQGTGGMLESIANMANSILGAGIIGLPYAIREAGLVFGIILLVSLCAVTDWTIRLIVINAKLSGRNSYIGVMDQAFGPAGRAAISFFQFAFAFGGMCAFGIIIGDTIPHVIRAAIPGIQPNSFLSLVTNRSFIVVLCTVCVSYPLSLYRDISKLARASGLALVGMLIIVLSVVIEGEHVTEDLKGDPSQRYTFIGSEVFQAIGVISFAFVCHHNSLLIYGSLNTPTLDRFAAVTHVSTAISLVFCLLLGLAGFLVFTDKTQGNILNNFAANDTLINVARFCFGMNMFTTLPLELFVCREVIEQYFFEHEEFDHHRHIISTTIILFGAMLLSLVTCDLGVMLEITGGVSATALAFIFPALCFIRLSRDTPWTSRSKIAAAACASFGAIVLVLSVFLTLQKAWSGDHSEKVCT